MRKEYDCFRIWQCRLLVCILNKYTQSCLISGIEHNQIDRSYRIKMNKFMHTHSHRVSCAAVAARASAACARRSSSAPPSARAAPSGAVAVVAASCDAADPRRARTGRQRRPWRRLLRPGAAPSAGNTETDDDTDTDSDSDSDGNAGTNEANGASIGHLALAAALLALNCFVLGGALRLAWCCCCCCCSYCSCYCCCCCCCYFICSHFGFAFLIHI